MKKLKLRKFTRGAASNSYVCEICTKKFKNKNSRRSHKHQYHTAKSRNIPNEETEDLKKLSCEFCAQEFSAKSYLEHRENCRGLKCDTCLVDRTFNSWASLYAHSWKCSEKKDRVH